MFYVTKFRIFIPVLLVLVVLYVSFVFKVINVFPSVNNCGDLKRSSSTQRAQQPINLVHTFPARGLNDEKNLTIKRLEFFKYIASQLADTPYPGVENFTQYVMAKLNLKPLAGVKPLRPEYGPVLNDVTSYKYPIEIEPCQYLSGSQNLFIAIISAVGNFEKRSIIRQTWIRHLLAEFQSAKNSSVNLSGYGFIVGQSKDQILSIKIKEESRKYGDILQVGIIDYYFNLTLKAVGLVNWLNNHCSEVDFVLKVDDDIYVNVRNLGAVITNTLNRSEKIFYGTSTWHPTERDGRWKISYEDYPWTMFPSYPNGGAVLLPGIAIGPLLAAAQTTPFLPFDDTYLLGLCTEKAGIRLHGTGRMFAIGGNLDPCHVYNFITWLANSTNLMNNSYWTTEDFYKNVIQCIFTDSFGINRITDPFNFLIEMD